MVSLDKSHLFQCVRALKSVSRGVFVCVCFHIYATWCLSESLSQSARSRQQSLVQMRLCITFGSQQNGREVLEGRYYCFLLPKSAPQPTQEESILQKLLQSESNLHNTERGNFGLICIAERHQKLTQSQGYASKADIDTKGVSL